MTANDSVGVSAMRLYGHISLHNTNGSGYNAGNFIEQFHCFGAFLHIFWHEPSPNKKSGDFPSLFLCDKRSIKIGFYLCFIFEEKCFNLVRNYRSVFFKGGNPFKIVIFVKSNMVILRNSLKKGIPNFRFVFHKMKFK